MDLADRLAPASRLQLVLQAGRRSAATGAYEDAVQGKMCRDLYKRPEARLECMRRAMAQEAEWKRDQEEAARRAAARAAARGQPPPSAVQPAVDSAYERAKRVGELQGRMDVRSNQQALLVELGNIASLQEAFSSVPGADPSQLADLAQSLRVAIQALETSYDR